MEKKKKQIKNLFIKNSYPSEYSNNDMVGKEQELV